MIRAVLASGFVSLDLGSETLSKHDLFPALFGGRAMKMDCEEMKPVSLLSDGGRKKGSNKRKMIYLLLRKKRRKGEKREKSFLVSYQ